MYELAQMPVSFATWAGIKGVRSVLIQVFAGLERLQEGGKWKGCKDNSVTRWFKVTGRKSWLMMGMFSCYQHCDWTSEVPRFLLDLGCSGWCTNEPGGFVFSLLSTSRELWSRWG